MEKSIKKQLKGISTFKLTTEVKSRSIESETLYVELEDFSIKQLLDEVVRRHKKTESSYFDLTITDEAVYAQACGDISQIGVSLFKLMTEDEQLRGLITASVEMFDIVPNALLKKLMSQN